MVRSWRGHGRSTGSARRAGAGMGDVRAGAGCGTEPVVRREGVRKRRSSGGRPADRGEGTREDAPRTPRDGASGAATRTSGRRAGPRVAGSGRKDGRGRTGRERPTDAGRTGTGPNGPNVPGGPAVRYRAGQAGRRRAVTRPAATAAGSRPGGRTAGLPRCRAVVKSRSCGGPRRHWYLSTSTDAHHGRCRPPAVLRPSPRGPPPEPVRSDRSDGNSGTVRRVGPRAR